MGIEATLDTALAHAVRKAGSQSAFGRLIRRNQSTVNLWLSQNKDLPAEHVLTVERETGVSRHALRPDLYPDESGHEPAADRAVPSAGGVEFAR